MSHLYSRAMGFILLKDHYEDGLGLVADVFSGSGTVHLPDDGTAFFAAESGHVDIGASYSLQRGMFGALPGRWTLEFLTARLLIVRIKRYLGIPLVGGPIEDTGRLQYIDGCSDTGLIQPLRLGDPCLNYLHFPMHINQTQHTHPSHRLGIVMRGRGECHHEHGVTVMRQGDVFVIPAYTVHGFCTGTDIMDIIAFHPDSVFGPTDEHHQMLDATQEVAMHGGG